MILAAIVLRALEERLKKAEKREVMDSLMLETLKVESVEVEPLEAKIGEVESRAAESLGRWNKGRQRKSPGDVLSGMQTRSVQMQREIPFSSEDDQAPRCHSIRRLASRRLDPVEPGGDPGFWADSQVEEGACLLRRENLLAGSSGERRLTEGSSWSMHDQSSSVDVYPAVADSALEGTLLVPDPEGLVQSSWSLLAQVSISTVVISALHTSGVVRWILLITRLLLGWSTPSGRLLSMCSACWSGPSPSNAGFL